MRNNETNYFYKLGLSKGLSAYAISSLALNFSGLFAGLIVYKWVDPYHIGLWQSLMMVEVYTTFLRLGVINGMNRQLPYWLGKDNVDRANRILETTLYYTIVVMGIVCAAGIFYSVFFKPLSIGIGLILIVVVYITVNIYNSYLLGTFRSGNDFKRLRKIQNLQALLKLVFIVPVIYFGFEGYIYGQLIMLILVTLFTFTSRPFKYIRPVFHKEEFLELIKIGLPIFLGSYFIAVISTIPRVILLKYGSIEVVGLYAPLATIIAVVMVIPDSIVTYLYPKMVFSYGKNEQLDGLWRKTIFSQLGIVIIGIPVALISFYILPFAIDNYLSNYRGSISIIEQGIFIIFFSGHKFAYSTFVVLKKWKVIFVFIIIFFTAQVVLPLILLNYCDVIKAVIWGQMIATAITTLSALGLCYKITH